MEQIKVVIKNTRERPKEIYIDNTLESLQEIVDGYIEVTSISEGILLVLNEEGKINGSEENFAVMTMEQKGEAYENQLHDVIFGNCFFVASDGEDFASLSENQLSFIQSKFNVAGTLFIIDINEVSI